MKKAAKTAAKTAAEAPAPEHGSKRVWLFFLFFALIIILMLSYYGYTQYAAEKQRKDNQYNGFDFSQAQGGLWVARIEVGKQPYDIPFYYHPRDTESVIVDKGAILPVIKAPRVLYISYDPDAGAQPVVAGVEISRITGSKYNLYNIETHGALSRPSGVKADLPVVSCANATADMVVIQFVEAKQNVIARSDKNPNCILLNYQNASESVRVADRFAYMLLRIQ